MKELMLEYVVIHLGMVGQLVEMRLREPERKPSTMDVIEETVDMDRVRKVLEEAKPAKGKSFDDKQMFEELVDAYIDAMKARGPELMMALLGRPPKKYSGDIQLDEIYGTRPTIVLTLTPEQYAEMGSPSLFSKVKLYWRNED